MIDLSAVITCWKADKNRRNLWLPVILGCGIGAYFLLPFEPNKWITLWVIEIMIALALLLRRRIRLLYMLGCAFIFVLGFAIIQLKSIYLDSLSRPLPLEEAVYFKGVISGIDTNYKGKLRFTFDEVEDYDGNFYAGKYRITPRGDASNVKIGQCIEMIGTFMPPSSEALVGGYQFDRKSYFDGLKGNGYAESRFFPAECPQHSAHFWRSHIAEIRQNIVARINRVLPPAQAAVAAAIIAGDKSAVSVKLYDQYRNSGLAHFLAISGLHMSMLSGLMFFLVRLILAFIPWISLRFDTRKIAAVFALGLAFVYLLISGLAVPAQRAFVMIAVVLLGVLTNRRAISMNSVALAAFIILLISPEVLISASFQMSFAAVVGLIAFYEKYSAAIHNYFLGGNRWWQGLKLYIMGILVTDFIASISTLPFAIYHFNMVALYTTLGNLLSGPVIGFVIMPCVLLALLLMPFGASAFLLKAAGFGIGLVNQITAAVSSLPYAGLHLPSFPFVGFLLIIFGGLWLTIWQCRWRIWGSGLIAVGFLSLLFVRTPDIIVGDKLKAIAFKNSQRELEIVPSSGGSFIKQVWRSRYPVSAKPAVLKAHPEFLQDGDIVTIGAQQFNIKDIIGFSAYRHGNDYIIRTIRDDIGNRLWNKNN